MLNFSKANGTGWAAWPLTPQDTNLIQQLSQQGDMFAQVWRYQENVQLLYLWDTFIGDEADLYLE